MAKLGFYSHASFYDHAIPQTLVTLDDRSGLRREFNEKHFNIYVLFKNKIAPHPFGMVKISQMKWFLFSVLFLSVSVQAKILKLNSHYYIEKSSHEIVPIQSLNRLIDEKQVSDLRLYRKGLAHVISMKNASGETKNYSIGMDGYYYDIQPFSGYQIQSVDAHGLIEFKEFKNRKYYVNEQGLYIY